MGFSSIRKAQGRAPGSILAALDVGSSKVACFIASVEDNGHLRCIGIGHHATAGVRAGVIVEMEAAAAGIAHAVHQAERMAGVHLSGALVNLAGVHAQSHLADVSLSLASGQVSDVDIARAITRSRQLDVGEEQELVHAMPVGYTLDGQRGIEDPIGMYGKTLGVRLHLVSGAVGPMRNLVACIERTEAEVDAFCIGAFASGLAVLTDDEQSLGVILLDIGGGTTDIAVFEDRQLLYSDCLPVGGQHVTNDIARGIGTAVQHAERLKTLYGAAEATGADDHELLEVPVLGEEAENGSHAATMQQIQRSLLIGIMRPRLEEIFELVRARLDHAGLGAAGSRRVVLTGGSSQVSGLREMAQMILDRQVRLGRPTRLTGLAPAAAGPSFAAVAGLLQYGLHHRVETIADTASLPVESGLWQRIGGWLKENL